MVSSTPMSRGEYNDYRCWDLPENEDGSDDGYLVEYLDGGKPNHECHEGYISWSPKEQFENAYRTSGELTFGDAIFLMKKGSKVRRKGWNGKGIFIAIQTPDAHSNMTSPYIYIDTTGLQTDNLDAPKTRVPWLASQTDMMAEDYVVI